MLARAGARRGRGRARGGDRRLRAVRASTSRRCSGGGPRRLGREMPADLTPHLPRAEVIATVLARLDDAHGDGGRGGAAGWLRANGLEDDASLAAAAGAPHGRVVPRGAGVDRVADDAVPCHRYGMTPRGRATTSQRHRRRPARPAARRPDDRRPARRGRGPTGSGPSSPSPAARSTASSPRSTDAGLLRLGEQGPRASQQYVITAAGKRAFRGLAGVGPGPDALRSPLVLRLLHAGALPADERAELRPSRTATRSAPGWRRRGPPPAARTTRTGGPSPTSPSPTTGPWSSCSTRSRSTDRHPDATPGSRA